MKKIMFNDKFGLTEAVLSGSKTLTIRVAYDNALVESLRTNFVHQNKLAIYDGWNKVALSKYGVGEIVAIAQSYHVLNNNGYVAPEWLDHTCESSAGYENKMCVCADPMPHAIQINDIKVERLQDISGDDILRVGIQYDDQIDRFLLGNKGFFFAKDAFAYLIKEIYGKGSWERNPFVFVYSFNVVKL